MPNDPLVSVRGERTRFPLPVRILWRYFVTGQPLRGPGDNATFFHRATVDYRARPYVTLSGPIWQRLARRHAAFTVPALLVLVEWWLAATWLIAASLVTIGWLTVKTVNVWRHGRQNREWVDPAARVLCVLTKTRYTRRRGREMIELPRGWGVGTEQEQRERPAARVRIPAGTALSASLKKQIEINVGNRLGILEPVKADWREAGTAVEVELSAAPLPPEKVSFAGLDLDACLEDEWVAGRKPGDHLVTCSLSEDSPHFLLSGAAGTGKSVLVRVLAVQRLLRGDGVVILDPKRFSHWRWAGGGKLPREQVVYAYRDEDLHDAWMAVGDEIKRRIELPEDELEGQRRVFIIVEEANVQAKKLTRYWRGVRKEIMLTAKQAQVDDAPFEVADLDPPVQSPAIVAMQESVCMGRELKMHVVVAAQRASASIFGGNGGDIRESFQGGRFIAKWDRKLWKMLVDTIAYVPWPAGKRGIWGLARGDSFDIFRVPWLTEQEALDTVLSKAPPATGPVLGVQRTRARLDTLDMDSGELSKGQERKALTVKINQETVDKLPGQPSLSSVQRASTRDRYFPEPVGQDGVAKLYRWTDLLQWQEDRLPALSRD